MAYSPVTDFLALVRNVGGAATLAEMPGLDYVVTALARAGLFRLWTGQSPPTVDQATTVWLLPSSPSWVAEGTVFLWNAGTSEYEIATSALWDTLFNGAALVTFDRIAPTTTPGDIIYRNATTNTRLGAGTPGYVLQTNGVSADPAWVDHGIVTPEMFGADGTPSGDRAAIQLAINSGAPKIQFLGRTYLKDAVQISGASNQIWLGVQGQTAIKQTVPPTAGTDMIFFNTKTNFQLVGITFDGNGQLTAGSGHFPTLLPTVHISACDNFSVVNCKAFGFYNQGILANIVHDCKFIGNYLDRGTAATFINGGLSISGSAGFGAGTSYNILVQGNTFKRCQISSLSRDTIIAYNEISGWGFSAGINTQAISGSTNNLIIGNHCHDSNQAPDASPYNIGGIENWASNTTIIGNVCHGNYGNNIDQGGAYCTVVGNICYDSTLGCGIYLLAQDATFNASSCIVEGNRCYDSRGAGARTQLYGLVEQAGSNLGDVIIGQNNFRNNKLGKMSLQAAAITDHDEGTWVPTLTGITFASASGTWQRTGKTVTWSASITMPATANSNPFWIDGLPFTAAADSAGFVGLSSVDNFRVYVGAGTTRVSSNKTNANLSGVQMIVGGTFLALDLIYP